MSNTRHVKQPPRAPDATELAFRAELRRGCPYCGSRTVTEQFRAGVWDFGLRCEASCRTFTEPALAHKVASQAAERAGRALGEPLQYQAFDTSTGQIEGAVLARAGG